MMDLYSCLLIIVSNLLSESSATIYCGINLLIAVQTFSEVGLGNSLNCEAVFLINLFYHFKSCSPRVKISLNGLLVTFWRNSIKSSSCFSSFCTNSTAGNFTTILKKILSFGNFNRLSEKSIKLILFSVKLLFLLWKIFDVGRLKAHTL